MKYFIIVGEASGDMYAADMIREIKMLDGNASFRFWGGDLMAAQVGSNPEKHYRELAFMGFFEVLMNISTILKNFKICKQDIVNFAPDVLILVDYPGFNLRMAEFANKNGIRTFYYISPTLWAWNESRIKVIKKYVDKLFVILPFEKEFYRKFNYDVDFIGYPLIDVLEKYLNHSEKSKSISEQHNQDGKPIVAILPGSRKQEVIKNLSVMLSVSADFPKHQFIVAGVKTLPESLYNEQIQNLKNVKIVYNQTYSILENADAALVKSGTSTMEAALLNVPQVVCYRVNYITYSLAKKLAKVKYIAMVNLIMNRLVVKELIQNDLNYTNLKTELNKLLFDTAYRKLMLEDYVLLRNKLGGTGASKRLAELIVQYLKEKNARY